MRVFRDRFRGIVALIAMAFSVVVLGSCNPMAPPGAGSHQPVGPLAMHKGLSFVDSPHPDRVVAGQTIYVPAYSSTYILDRAERFDLAVTLAVRNTDQSRPIIITMVRYLGQSGEIVRDYLEKPVQIAPLASAGFFVAESDTKAGALASFLVEWVAPEPVSQPIAESTMTGVAGTQGISFLCVGRVIADRAIAVKPTVSSPGSAQ
jgi:Protein of unknown function (DUF3124)